MGNINFLMITGVSLYVLSTTAKAVFGSPATTPLTAAPVDDDKGGAHGFLAFGRGKVPALDGAKKNQFVPIVIGEVDWQRLGVGLRGLGRRVYMLGESRFQFGPTIAFRGKRNSSKDGSGRVKLLDDVGFSLEVSWHIGYRFGGSKYGYTEIALGLSVAKDVNDSHNGLVGSAQGSYAAYRPDGGIRNAGAGIIAGYQFDERWGVFARAGANYCDHQANATCGRTSVPFGATADIARNR